MTVRVALLGGPDAEVAALARALAAHDVDATVLGRAGLAPLAAVLGARKIGDGLDRVPAALAALGRGHFDFAHAFGPGDAVPALAWRRVTGRPLAVTFTEPLRRESMAARRLRLATLSRTLADADALRSADAEVAASVRRWAAVDAPVLALADAAGSARLYRELSAMRARGRPGAGPRRNR